MTYFRTRRDYNHGTIQRAFEGQGNLTFDTSMVGGGWPDIMVLDRFFRRLHMVEAKNRETSYGRNASLNDNQSRLEVLGWPIEVACDIEDVMTLCKQWEKKTWKIRK